MITGYCSISKHDYELLYSMHIHLFYYAMKQKLTNKIGLLWSVITYIESSKGDKKSLNIRGPKLDISFCCRNRFTVEVSLCELLRANKI